MNRRPLRVLALLAASLLAHAAAAATFSAINVDAATGPRTLNDTTAFTPVGGNNATTYGQALLNVVAEAGRRWGQRVTSSQTVIIEASSDSSMACTSNSATLSTAGPRAMFTLPDAPNVLLPVALVDALTNSRQTDRNGAPYSDISLSISSIVGSGSGCLGGRTFYLGFDHKAGTGIDLLNVLLHEIGHGLGFLSLAASSGTPPKDRSTGASLFTGYEQHVYNETLGKYWPGMTDAERASSALADGKLVFDGPYVNANLSAYLGTQHVSSGGHLKLYAPTTWQDGSSVSHWWDTSTGASSPAPYLLMQPYTHSNLGGLTDMTGCVLEDIGWPAARCPDSSTNDSAPAASAQSVTVQSGQSANITLSASDADGDVLTYSIRGNPANGTLSGTPPAIVYAPRAGFTGADSFQFVANDGLLDSAPATVSIAVNGAAAVAVTGSSSGGGGAMDLFALGLLGTATACGMGCRPRKRRGPEAR